jgi:hypothetical protein
MGKYLISHGGSVPEGLRDDPISSCEGRVASEQSGA